MTRVRILSCDAWSLPRPALASLVRDLDPDLACLRRAPRYPGWRGRVVALARQFRLLYAGGGGSSGGTALLTATRVDVRQVREYRLPDGPVRSILGSRGVVAARLAKGGVAFGAACVNVGRDGSARGGRSGDVGRRLGAATLVLGDGMDPPPDGVMWARLARRLADSGPGQLVPPPGAGGGIFVAGAATLDSYQLVPAAGRTHRGHHLVVADVVLADSP